jgi:hypothetical protein
MFFAGWDEKNRVKPCANPKGNSKGKNKNKSRSSAFGEG